MPIQLELKGASIYICYCRPSSPITTSDRSGTEPDPTPPDKELLTGDFLKKNRNLRDLGNAQPVPDKLPATAENASPHPKNPGFLKRLLGKAARTIGLAVPLAASDPLSGHPSLPAKPLERNAEIETRDVELTKENRSKNFNKTAGSSPPPDPTPPDKELLTGDFLKKNRNLRDLGNAQPVQAIKPGDGGGGGGGGGRSGPVERRAFRRWPTFGGLGSRR